MFIKRLRASIIYIFLRILHKLFYINGRRVRRLNIVMDGVNLRIVLLPYIFIPVYTVTQIPLCKILKKAKGKTICEIGSGSGIISVYLASSNRVVASDIEYNAILCTKINLKLNKRYGNADLILMDGATALRSNIFDVTVLNPPYLPLNAKDEIDLSYCGGGDLRLLFHLVLDSIRVIKREGRVYMTLNDIVLDNVVDFIKKLKFKVKVFPCKKTIFDKIFIVMIEK